MLETILERMDEDGGGTLDLGGKKLKLSAKASLAGVATEDLFTKFKALVPPAKVFFADVSYDRVVPNCGNDHVTAVNLARPIDAKEVPSPRAVTKAIQAVCSRYPSADAVELVHHIGGPCHDEQIATCMVLVRQAPSHSNYIYLFWGGRGVNLHVLPRNSIFHSRLSDFLDCCLDLSVRRAAAGAGGRLRSRWKKLWSWLTAGQHNATTTKAASLVGKQLG